MQKPTLDLLANNNGVLDHPVNVSRELLLTLAEKVRTGIIRTTADCRRWIRETFANEGEVEVVHGFVDRIRNTALCVGGRTMPMDKTLALIDRREGWQEQDQVRAHDHAAREVSLRGLLGTDFSSHLPQLHSFLAHGWWDIGDSRKGQALALYCPHELSGHDPAQYERAGYYFGLSHDTLRQRYRTLSDTLAQQLAALHGEHLEAFQRLSPILLQRCERILDLYQRGWITSGTAFLMTNCIAQSGAVDDQRMRVLGAQLKRITAEKGDDGTLSTDATYAMATGMHVPKWQQEEIGREDRPTFTPDLIR